MSRRKQSQEPPPTVDDPTAPLAHNRTSQRSTRSSNPTFVPNQAPAPSTRRSSNAAPSVPCMLLCCFLGSPQTNFTSQTPAARMAQQLLGCLDATTTSMASPGPRRGNRGHYSDDEELSDSEDLAPIPPPRRRRNIQPGFEGEPVRGRAALSSPTVHMEDLSAALNTHVELSLMVYKRSLPQDGALVLRLGPYLGQQALQ
ncbi:hypothetical protein K438DRAFT_2067914 [Mycena galopus ATCC 62051]|nr:hypothetical protein K438DRAFT_2067914 [Mycena galopus ATCC 62051]